MKFTVTNEVFFCKPNSQEGCDSPGPPDLLIGNGLGKSPTTLKGPLLIQSRRSLPIDRKLSCVGKATNSPWYQSALAKIKVVATYFWTHPKRTRFVLQCCP